MDEEFLERARQTCLNLFSIRREMPWSSVHWKLPVGIECELTGSAPHPSLSKPVRSRAAE